MNKFVNDKGDTLNYRLLNPDYSKLRKYPLVIFLHGSGERGNDNEAQLKWGVANFATDQAMTMHPAYVMVPQCPAGQSWSNFTRNEKPEEVRLRNRGDISLAASIKHIPVWIFHGSEDGVVNPVLSILMADALTKAGAHPGFTLYPETGHFSWLAAYSDPLMMEWMFRQHK